MRRIRVYGIAVGVTSTEGTSGWLRFCEKYYKANDITIPSRLILCGV